MSIIAKEKKAVSLERVDADLYESVVNQKLKNDYIQRRIPVIKCLLNGFQFNDIFVVSRSFVMLTTDFIEMLSSLSYILFSFARDSLWLN